MRCEMKLSFGDKSVAKCNLAVRGNLSELLRLVQLYNATGYETAPAGRGPRRRPVAISWFAVFPFPALW